jgi:D-3-phosphoglycerate dehydrogenase
MAYKVLVTDPLSEEGLKILRQEKELQVEVKTGLKPEELKQIIGDYDALIVRSETKVTKEIIEAGKKLKVIGRAGVGLDNVDEPQATLKGIVVMNTPGGNTISTAEHTFSMIMALSRNISQANQSVKSGLWERKKFMGVELQGKVLGIIGLGRIGTEVAKRAKAFAMKILAYDPYLTAEKAEELDVELADLEKIFKVSDYITVHVPLNEETKHLISQKEFALMKKGARVVNCARGGIIDEAALYEALKSGQLAGAALDVYEKEPPKDSPLLTLDNLVATPHLGASTEEAQVNVAVDIARQVTDALLGRGFRNAVNVPCIEAELCKILQPYVSLAEKLGLLASQIAEGRISSVKISYSGEIVEMDTAAVSVALVKGLLSPFMGEDVNYVNALVVARARGIKVVESKSSELENFANLISLELETDKGKTSASATLFTKEKARIVEINTFLVEVIPEGYMLIIDNQDRPGIIGQIGTLLGKNEINIAGMTFGREKPGGRAITVLNVDSEVPQAVLAEIKKAKNILGAKLIKL